MKTIYLVTKTHFSGEFVQSQTKRFSHYVSASSAYYGFLYEALAAFGKLDTTYAWKKEKERRSTLLKGVDNFEQVICKTYLLTFKKIT